MIKTRLGSHFKAWYIHNYIKDKKNKGDFARRLKDDKDFPISKDKNRLLVYLKNNKDKYIMETDAVLLCQEWQAYMESCMVREIENRLKRNRTLYENIWNKLNGCWLSDFSNNDEAAVRILKEAGCCIIYTDGKSYHVRGCCEADFPLMSEGGFNTVYLDSGFHFVSKMKEGGKDTLLFRAYFTDMWKISVPNVPDETCVKEMFFPNETDNSFTGTVLYKKEW